MTTSTPTHETCDRETCCEKPGAPGNTFRFEPRVDILETEQELTLFADLPGVNADGLDIHYEDGELRIAGRCAPRESGSSFWMNEYQIGDFERSFRIADSLDTDRISAELKNGVLTVHLPKVAVAKPRRIEVTA